MLKYLIYFIVITTIGILYDRYKTKMTIETNKSNIDLIQKYLLNDSALTGSKPIIWVHINYDSNARQWLNFGSRRTTRLNMPFLHITLQSIINQSNNDFNVCLIDDDSFSKLIPGWSVDLHNLADPVRSYVRNLAMTKLLYYYGGMQIPSSYLALRPLKEIYDTHITQNGVFVGESSPSSEVSTYVTSFPNSSFMGCTKEHPVMKDIMLYLERLDSRDFTQEQQFLGQINRYYYKHVHEGKMTVVSGSLLGTKTQKQRPVLIDDLMSENYIDYSEQLNGILVPCDALLKRVKYGWFVRSSVEQIYQTNNILSKYMLISNNHV